MARNNLLFRWFSEVEHQAVINKTLQFLAITVITNADDRNPAYVDASNKISNTTPIYSRHTVNFIHD